MGANSRPCPSCLQSKLTLSGTVAQLGWSLARIRWDLSVPGPVVASLDGQYPASGKGRGIMNALSFSAVGEAEQERVYATLVLAFAADPVERWLYPEPQQYLLYFPRFLAAFGGRAFAGQTVWSLGESAAALWLPPGTEADGDAITTSLAETVTPDKHDDMFAVLGQMDTAHPGYPHWYLPWFAVDIALQGAGLGSQLLELCLQVVDDTHQPAYLETPNPRSISFYQRHGFEVTGEARAGTCPPITFMLRAAR